jgi:hypothetical protein
VTPLHRPQQCHIRVRFDAETELDYRAERAAADAFAAAVRANGTQVIIDDRVGDALPPLPCERLWL